MSDLIDRQQALEIKFSNAIVRRCAVYVRMDELVNKLNALPTVQPEARTGKWTLGFDNKYMEKYYYCSCCGGRKYGEYKPLDYFCSNCGADMRGEQDE